MWPFRTSVATRRARRVAQLRRAQELGAACVVCGRTRPAPPLPMFANGIHGFGCVSHTNVLALPPGSLR
ncbi:hypothetical protein ACFHW2_12245 [Actinomadura sp. LOL_016]|uniref:hypothetical protein n=1 Tax=unclassified Actinomadura TaxID=2626254 RepID=UPI003A8035A2